jgi:hypothetical protein
VPAVALLEPLQLFDDGDSSVAVEAVPSAGLDHDDRPAKLLEAVGCESSTPADYT